MVGSKVEFFDRTVYILFKSRIWFEIHSKVTHFSSTLSWAAEFGSSFISSRKRLSFTFVIVTWERETFVLLSVSWWPWCHRMCFVSVCWTWCFIYSNRSSQPFCVKVLRIKREKQQRKIWGRKHEIKAINGSGKFYFCRLCATWLEILSETKCLKSCFERSIFLFAKFVKTTQFWLNKSNNMYRSRKGITCARQVLLAGFQQRIALCERSCKTINAKWNTYVNLCRLLAVLYTFHCIIFAKSWGWKLTSNKAENAV